MKLMYDALMSAKIGTLSPAVNDYWHKFGVAHNRSVTNPPRLAFL